MNLNQLQTFVMVVEKKSFSAAAKALGLSQPAVTLQVKSLEDYLGVGLFDRTKKRIELTLEGKLFYPAASEVLLRLGKTQRELDELSETLKGRLVVGGSTIPGQYILPKVLGLFKKAHPDVVLSLEIGDTRQIVDKVLVREIDVGVVGAYIKRKQLEIVELTEDELVLIAPFGHEWAGKRKALASLSEVPFIFREEGSGTRRAVEEFLIARKFASKNLNVSLELGSSEAVVSAVEAGLGLSVISRWAADKALCLKRVQIVNLEGLPLKRKFYLISGKQFPSKVTETFLKFVGFLDAKAIKPV